MLISTLLQTTLSKVLETFSHNWYLLLLSILVSVVLKLYIDEDAIERFLRRNTKNSILMSTGVAVLTPLCSCGTTAIMLGMMASTVPWAPIVAFLVASPLTSPQELFYSAGLFGWNFAIAFFAASILLGLAAGGIAAFAESKGWLTDQARLRHSTSVRASLQAVPVATTFAQPQIMTQARAQFSTQSVTIALPVMMSSPSTEKRGVGYSQSVREAFDISWRLLIMFFGFTFIGYFLNGLIPNEWIQTLFGSGRVYSIPLAATLGLPFYLNTEASMPLIRALIDAGMSPGAALAFLITGAGTSIGAIMGALTIARWRVIGIVIGTLWVGAVVLGFAYDLFIPLF